MSDLIRISTANAHHPPSALSKSRTEFVGEASSRSTHICRAINAAVKRYTLPLQTTLSLAQAATRPPRRNTALRSVFGLLRRWQERAYSHSDCGRWRAEECVRPSLDNVYPLAPDRRYRVVGGDDAERVGRERPVVSIEHERAKCRRRLSSGLARPKSDGLHGRPQRGWCRRQ